MQRLRHFPPTFPQFLERSAFSVRPPINGNVTLINKSKGMVGAALLVTAVALFTLRTSSLSPAATADQLLSATLAVVGGVTAFHLVPQTRIGTAFRASDALSVSVFWTASLASVSIGLFGALLLALTAEGPLQDLLGADDIEPAVLTIASVASAAMSLGTLTIGLQGRFTQYIGVTSFRRGSAFLPSAVIVVVACGYLAAVSMLAVQTGVVATTVLVSTVVAVTTATFGALRGALRSMRTTRNTLMITIDDLQVALRGDDEAELLRRTLAFNRAYSGRTALRHPLVTASVRSALDIVVVRAVGADLGDRSWMAQHPSPVVRDLTREDARVLLGEGSSLVRAHLAALDR